MEIVQRHDTAWPEGVDVEKLTDGVAIISARLANRYRTFAISQFDISQELWLLAWRRRDKVQEYLAREDRIEQKRGWSALLTMLERRADRFCRKEKARICGYEPQDEFFFSEASLKDWIAVLVNGAGVLTNQVNDLKVRTSKSLAEGFSLEATLADVRKAMDLLDPVDHALVTLLYGENVNSETVGEMLGLGSRSTVERKGDQVIRRMLKTLGGARP